MANQMTVAKPKAKPGTKAAHKTPAPPAPSSRPFIRFYLSEDLHEKMLAILDTMEQAADATDHREDLADVIEAFMDAGMAEYFINPLKLANIGFILEQSATLGLTGVETAMSSVIRKIISRMDSVQLLSICASIRGFMA